MTEEEMLKNVRMMEGMFPAFIEHYKRVAFAGKMQTWAKAMHSVIDLVAQDAKCPHDFFPEECGLCHDAALAAERDGNLCPHGFDLRLECGKCLEERGPQEEGKIP